MDELTVNAQVEDRDGGAGHAVRVFAVGDVDVATAPLLTEQFDKAIANGAALIILDAAGIEFLDSSGIRVLVATRNKLADTGGRLLVEGLRGTAQRVLEISGLLDSLDPD